MGEARSSTFTPVGKLMNLHKLEGEMARREFLVRSVLLSVGGAMASSISAAEKSRPTESVPTGGRKAVLEIFNKASALDKRPFSPERLALADGEIVWSVRDASGKIVPKVVPATGKVYRPAINNPLPPTDQRTLKQYVMTDLADKTADPCVTFFADDSYYLPTVDELKLIVADSSITAIARVPPVPNQFDCDDFAYAMKGAVSLVKYRDRQNPIGQVAFCFGILAGNFDWIGPAHVACFTVEANNKKVQLLDPRHQSSGLFLVNVDQSSKISLILM